MKNNNLFFLSLIVVIIFAVFITSCREKVREKDTINLVDIRNIKADKLPAIGELYITSSDYNSITPKVLEDLKNNESLFARFKESTQLEVEDALENYLQRKRVYDKSAIFDEVP